MIIEDYYQKTKREFKAECLIKTGIHEVGKVYNVITYAKLDSFIYVEDEKNYQHLTFSTFFDFLEKFKIV
jgi:hypothetical protein